jgi:hypothetical protein
MRAKQGFPARQRPLARLILSGARDKQIRPTSPKYGEMTASPPLLRSPVGVGTVGGRDRT